ncbi:MAG: nucleotidyltransferase family protein [Mariprofundaceae bacterium]|nr:nucleotidyltransferase family protein [Mariprofundaceae bacterium]
MQHNANPTDKPLRAQYTRLLCGFLPNKSQALDQSFWSPAWHEGIGACLWHSLQQHNAGLTKSLRPYIEQALREQTAHTLILRSASTEVLALFAEHNIEVLILRGQAVAEVLYPSPNLRPQTDIDLLIRQTDVARVEKMLGKAGFKQVPHQPLLFVRRLIMLDVHTEPLGIERMAAWASLTPLRAADFFAASTLGNIAGQAALLVKPEVNLPYLCFHAMKHSFERLIWLWDIALLAQQVNRDQCWDDVLHNIKKLALERPCFYALSYTDTHLGATLPPEVLSILRPDMDWRERQLFERFMQHEQIPFLAERIFARMQPDFRHRMAFWKETLWPRAEIRRQVDIDPSANGGFLVKRLQQIGKAALMLLRELRIRRR